MCTIASKISVTPKIVRMSEKRQNFVMKFDRIVTNLTYVITYGQVNSLRLKLSVALKWASKHLWKKHLFCWRWYLMFSGTFNYELYFLFE